MPERISSKFKIVLATLLPLLLAAPLALGQEDSTDPRAAAFSKLQPPMLTRMEWKAKPALPGLKPHTPRSIVVHHTAVKQNAKISLERKLTGLQGFSQRQAQMGSRTRAAWPDIPYHFYIDAGGKLGEARDPTFMGDSNTKYNLDGHVQVVIEGDFEQERPSAAQLEALTNTLLWLSMRWNIPADRINTYKDNAATSCPGRNITSEMPKILAAVRERRIKAVADLCAGSPPAGIASQYCGAK